MAQLSIKVSSAVPKVRGNARKEEYTLHLHWSPNQNFPTFTFKSQVNVGTYTNPMDPMGMAICFPSSTFGWRRGYLVSCPIKFGARQSRCLDIWVKLCLPSQCHSVQCHYRLSASACLWNRGDFTKVREQRTDFLRCKHTAGGPLLAQGTRAQGRFAQPQDILPANGRRL